MDPITPFVAGHLGGKALDKAVETVVSGIARLSRHRVEVFVRNFCAEAAHCLKCENDVKLNERINELLTNDAATDVLFECVRSVSVSRTRDLGPRIIAAIGARVISESRQPTDEEELILVAAESLSDQQIGELVALVQEARTEIGKSNKDYVVTDDGIIEFKFCEENFDSNWHRDDTVNVGPLNIGESLGRWALQPKSLGLIEDDVRERSWSYSEDSERHVDQDGTAREVTWWIRLPRVTIDFVELVQRVSQDYGRDAPTPPGRPVADVR